MSHNLDPIIQNCIIPYTLVPESQDSKAVGKVVKAFFENLTISKCWKEQSLNGCDFSEILNSMINVSSFSLTGLAVRFVKPSTLHLMDSILNRTLISYIRKSDLENVLKLEADSNKMKLNPKLPTCYENIFQRAVAENDIEMVRLLLEFGVDPTAEDNCAIRTASQYSRVEVVKLLLEQEGVDPSAKDNEAIRKALTYKNPEVMKLLLEHEKVDPSLEGNLIIMWASINGYTEVIRTLIERGVDPCLEENILIKIASQAGQFEVVKLLLDQPGVDPSAGENNALCSACANGYVEVVKLLLEQEAVDPSGKDNEPLRSASRNGHTEVVELLLERVDPEKAEQILAFTNGFEEFAKVLVNYFEEDS